MPLGAGQGSVGGLGAKIHPSTSFGQGNIGHNICLAASVELEDSPISTACAFDIFEVVEQVNDSSVHASLENAAGKSCQQIAAPYGSCGVLRLRLSMAIHSIEITEEMVKAAAENWQNGKEVMVLLLEKRGDEVEITEEVVKAAAGN